jgi:GntR family transcriptional regulator
LSLRQPNDDAPFEDFVVHRAPERFLHRKVGFGAADVDAHLRGQRVEQDIVDLDEVPAPAEVSNRLGLSEGEIVFVRRRLVRLAGGPPLQFAESYLPLDIAQGQIRAADSGPGGTYARIEDDGHILTRFKERFWYRSATADERDRLDLDEGVAVIEFYRVAFSGDRPVECFVSIKAANRHVFEYDIKVA